MLKRCKGHRKRFGGGLFVSLLPHSYYLLALGVVLGKEVGMVHDVEASSKVESSSLLDVPGVS